ncbi:MAG: hypothetical protein RE471_02910 [Ferroplasma sp.]|uniref:hypothetical protein n=1 Tax=Ferroplasma sp. TaxID=2591003 RepID=UPI002815EF88|nr:hypothetical protein [Ferroplasma sp.]WMT51837.1 MAG: hypothetical protein RE471_02910 [Ferroplasma sp.]
MEEKMAIEKIRNAVEIATKKIIVINDQNIMAENKENSNSRNFQHENFLNAMIYHELVSDSYFSFNDIYMEYPYPNDDLSADFVIKNVFRENEMEDFICEVKTFGYQYKSESFISTNNVKKYLYEDIEKLQNLMDYNNLVPVNGIVIIVNMTRYPGNYYEYKPMNILLETLKTMLNDGKYSDNMVFILSDNARAIAITADEIKRYKE